MDQFFVLPKSIHIIHERILCEKAEKSKISRERLNRQTVSLIFRAQSKTLTVNALNYQHAPLGHDKFNDNCTITQILVKRYTFV